MTSPEQPEDRDESLFIADFYPRLGAYLAQQHARGYDAVAARVRFLLWAAPRTDGAATIMRALTSRRRVTPALEPEARGTATPVPAPEAGGIDELTLTERWMLQLLGREPTPEELAAELDLSPSATSRPPQRPSPDHDV
jgi:Sigma-70 region 3